MSAELYVGDHLRRAPDAHFWTHTLFLRRFASVLDGIAIESAARSRYNEAYARGAARALADRVVAAVGEELAHAHLLLLHAFVDGKRAEAIEAVARNALGNACVDSLRSLGGDVRRHPLAVLLYAKDPDLLVHVGLWDRWHGRRLALYRRDLDHPVVGSLERWEAAAARALDTLRSVPGSGCGRFEEVRAIHADGPGDVLVALREWPHDAAVRTRSGGIATGQTPEWMLLRFSEHGRRLAVADASVDRGARLAAALLSEMGAPDAPYQPVLGALTERKLADFLRAVTDPDDATFPLVELSAALPVGDKRVMCILEGDVHPSVEHAVARLRALGPFGLDPATVRSVKVRFENRYTVQVHFPAAGEPLALSYSDLHRSKRVCARFAGLLQDWLQVEVPPRARRGSSSPATLARRAPPRVNAEAWWRAILAPSHEAPPAWLTEAFEEERAAPLVSVQRLQYLRCNDPFLDRKAVGVDSLDCDGDVLILEADPDDPLRHEDDREVRCSRGDHVWRPGRYQLPTRLRLLVTLRHEQIWRRLRESLSSYSVLREIPDRPGVVAVDGAGWTRHLVYLPLSAHRDDRLAETLGTHFPTAWIHTDGMGDVPSGSLHVATVLAKVTALAEPWRVSMTRMAVTARATIELAAQPASPTYGRDDVRVIYVRDTGIHVDGVRVAFPGQIPERVILSLHGATLDGEARDGRRTPWRWQDLRRELPADLRPTGKAQWQTWVSRTRAAFADALGASGEGADVIVTTQGRYQLGAGYVVTDQRTQETGDP